MFYSQLLHSHLTLNSLDMVDGIMNSYTKHKMPQARKWIIQTPRHPSLMATPILQIYIHIWSDVYCRKIGDVLYTYKCVCLT